MAYCLLPVEKAIAPAIVGARAAPLFSMKYSTAWAELRISGRLISNTVEVTLEEENGMNNAVRHIKMKKLVLFSTGVFKAKKRKIAPNRTPTLETRIRPFRVRLKSQSPIAPPTKYPAARINTTGP